MKIQNIKTNVVPKQIAFKGCSMPTYLTPKKVQYYPENRLINSKKKLDYFA